MCIRDRYNVVPLAAALSKLFKNTQKKVIAFVVFQEQHYTAAQRLLQEEHEDGVIDLSHTESRDRIPISPTILTGYLIALFVIIITYIGVNCLFSLQTHASFNKVPFHVGKES
eukprot:TRINITY_DN6622_c0_g1_i1.p1 TRINITY_DN6622_c0_g1~~TRINITY_DN6622_c0_g1_i1.p1  ORF type:complete len:113 (-),score=26.95 TRINITY_DN6622_c0_g1_i1:110-448(-)